MKLKAILAVLALALLSAGIRAETPSQELRFGLRATPESWPEVVRVLAAKPADGSNPLGLTLSIPRTWAEAPDWEALDRTVSAARAAKVLLCVTTELPADPGDRRNLTYLATLSEHVGEGVDALGLAMSQDQIESALRDDPDRLALTLKELTVALRGKSRARVLIGDVTPEDLPLMEPLYARDFRAYVEGYTSSSTDPTGEPSSEVVQFLQSYHLGAPLLLHLPRVEKPIAAQLLVLLAASRDVVTTDVEAADIEGTWTALLDLRARLRPAMGPGFSVQAMAVEDASGPRIDIGLINLLDADAMVQGLVMVPRIAASPKGTVDVKLPTGDVSDPVIYPLPSGAEVPVGYTADQKKGITVLRVPWEGRPAILFFNRLKTGTVGLDTASVSTAYRLPVEIILARHQAVQEAQDIFLDNYARDAQVDYHFKLPGGTGSLDVTFKNSFFFEKGLGARWVQNQFLINGVAWKGKKIPELPIVEPDKVNTLPLALTLGHSYTYKYVKDEAVEGRECFVVEFFPLPDATGSLYSGRVWIAKDDYAKIRMSVRQTGLQEPMVSNDEVDTYEPYDVGGGKTYWLLSRVRGQQIFSVLGQNVFAEREITFGPPRVNVPTFKEEVAQAEASDKPILQETDKGLKYLVKGKDGERRLQMEPKTGRLFAVGGFYYDKSLSYPLPLVGVNYFDYNWRKSKTQVNLLVAGAVNSLSASKMDILPKVDGSLTAVLFAIPFEDRFYPAGVEDQAQRLKVLREFAFAGLGWRVNQFSKLSLNFDVRYYHYARTGKTADGFELPKSHVDLGVGLSYDVAWRGWSASLEGARHHRSSWEVWGIPGQRADVSKFRDYDTWSLALSKAFYLPKFQKISAGVKWLDGRDLDRFSRYQFSYLGRESLSGFAGSGVRFDRGAIATLAYQFNVANVVRFGVTLDQARVQPVKDLGLWQNHTGLGLNAGVAGPWQTYWTLDAGYAVKSDIPAVRRDYTVALLVLKLW